MTLNTSFFDSMLDSVFIVNEKCEVVYVNEVGALLFNQTPRKVIRNKSALTQVFTFDPAIPELFQLLELKESSPYKEVKFTTSENTNGQIQLSIQPLPASLLISDSPIPLWLIYMRDVALEARLQMKYHRELDQKQDIIEELEKAKLELQKYSENLEKMVNERTKEIQELNHTMKALLDSLSEGFFIFNQQGMCLNISSKACQQTIEKIPNGLSIYEVLNIPKDQIEKFNKWTQTLFMEMLPFEDLAPLGPSSYTHSQNKEIRLNYYPLRSNSGSIEAVVTVATDITKLIEAEHEILFEKNKAKMIVNLVQNKKSVQTFVKDTQNLINQLKSELKTTNPNYIDVFRYLHTIKGGSAMFSISSMVESSHNAEEVNQQLINSSSPVLLEKLHQYVHSIESSYSVFLNEVTQILGDQALNNEKLLELPMSDFSKMLSQASQKNTAQQACDYLYNHVLLEPIGHHFQIYQKVLEVAATETSKQILPLELKDAHILIFPKPYEDLFKVLIHAFRNSVDHGIEKPDARIDAGKNEFGKISVSFKKSADQILISIQDDGQGIDPQRIREKLQEKGISLEGETDQQVIQHIFDPLFSTRNQISEISGRGIGMDAIQAEVKKLKGQVWVQSTPGQGTQIHIQIPYFDRDPTSHQVESKSAAA